ncbi:hypothetical protein D3C75_1103040 [compost metagenome]
MVQQSFARRRQRHALGLAHEQCHAQGLFELLQAFARCGNGNGFTGGSTGQGAFFVHGDE